MIRYLSFAALAALLVGCGDATDDPLAAEITHITVDANQSTMFATGYIQMHSTVYYTLDVPERNATENVQWRSSNTTVADVDEDGLVTGVTYGGDAVITGYYHHFIDETTIHVYGLTALRVESNETNYTQEQTVQLTAYGTFDDPDTTTLDVSDEVYWYFSDDNDSSAAIEQNGTLYTEDANGTLDINVTRNYDVNTSIRISVQ